MHERGNRHTFVQLPSYTSDLGRPYATLNGDFVSAAARPRSILIRHASRIESGWMSILAPVSLAARRAFCPSLPIASDSW